MSSRRSFSSHLQADGTYETQSRLIFTASRFDNGITLACQASNLVMESMGEIPYRAPTKIQVNCKSIISIIFSLHFSLFFPVPPCLPSSLNLSFFLKFLFCLSLSSSLMERLTISLCFLHYLNKKSNQQSTPTTPLSFLFFFFLLLSLSLSPFIIRESKTVIQTRVECRILGSGQYQQEEQQLMDGCIFFSAIVRT